MGETYGNFPSSPLPDLMLAKNGAEVAPHFYVFFTFSCLVSDKSMWMCDSVENVMPTSDVYIINVIKDFSPALKKLFFAI